MPREPILITEIRRWNFSRTAHGVIGTTLCRCLLQCTPLLQTSSAASDCWQILSVNSGVARKRIIFWMAAVHSPCPGHYPKHAITPDIQDVFQGLMLCCLHQSNLLVPLEELWFSLCEQSWLPPRCACVSYSSEWEIAISPAICTVGWDWHYQHYTWPVSEKWLVQGDDHCWWRGNAVIGPLHWCLHALAKVLSSNHQYRSAET